MTVSELTNVTTWLARCALSDPHQALAHLVAWLDPLQAEHDPDAYIEPYYYERGEDEFLMNAVSICRSCFPDVYAEVVQKLRRECPEAEINDFICKSINLRIGTEIDDIEWMSYGIPVPFIGVDIELDDFWEAFPRAVRVMACFGIEPKGSEMLRCGEVQVVVNTLITNLEAQNRQPCTDLVMLLKWLFSGTGNSLMDYTEEYWNDGGLDWLMWTPNDVEFAAEMIAEAYEMMDSAMRGLELLAEPEWFNAFKTNIEAIEHEIERRKKRGKPAPLTIRWPNCIEHPLTDTPAVEPELL